MNQGILQTIGNTPLVRLSLLFPASHFHLYAKLEAFNPGGSIKDRAAINILQTAIGEGAIGDNTTIVESSSGNMGIGLAMACTCLGLRFICVIDPKTTSQNVSILRAFGAEIDLVKNPDPVTGEYLPARIARVKVLLHSIPDAFWCNQYENMRNADAHHQTFCEIVQDLGVAPDFLFCATSSCGTLRGCSDYARMRGLPTRIVAVDAIGSAIFGDKPAKRLIPGMGAAIRPALFAENLAWRYIRVSDWECIAACRHLVRSEAILAGGSSGGVVAAIGRMKDEIPQGATCVAILCDRGERYLDTIYSDEWIRTHFADHLIPEENHAFK